MTVGCVVTVHLSLVAGGKSGVKDTRRRLRGPEERAQRQRKKMRCGGGGKLRPDCARNVGGRHEKGRSGHRMRGQRNEEKSIETESKDEERLEEEWR